MSSLAARSPRSRKSIGFSLGERNLNTEDGESQEQQADKNDFKAKGKARMSIGGEDPATLTSPRKITFTGGRKGVDTLSPRSQARRKAVRDYLQLSVFMESA